jgi:hypothetical protein
MRQYGYVTGDLAFLLGDGAQVLVETGAAVDGARLLLRARAGASSSTA